jgi:hypothetical protein
MQTLKTSVAQKNDSPQPECKWLHRNRANNATVETPNYEALGDIIAALNHIDQAQALNPQRFRAVGGTGQHLPPAADGCRYGGCPMKTVKTLVLCAAYELFMVTALFVCLGGAQ